MFFMFSLCRYALLLHKLHGRAHREHLAQALEAAGISLTHIAGFPDERAGILLPQPVTNADSVLANTAHSSQLGGRPDIPTNKNTLRLAIRTADHVT